MIEALRDCRPEQKSNQEFVPVADDVAATPFVLIPAGEFLMGSEKGQDEERPVHSVWVDAFEMADFAGSKSRLCAVHECHRPPETQALGRRRIQHPDQPVVAVNWTRRSSIATGSRGGRPAGYRLPTEAEWERAARGGREGMLYVWGNDLATGAPRVSASVGWRGERDPFLSRRSRPTRSVFTISAKTSTSGARTGSTRTITPVGG